MRMDALRHVFFLGIGGIGMSAIARYFLTQGVKVSGYDKTPSSLTHALEAEGISVSYDSNDLLPPDVDLMVVTPAVPLDHPAYRHCSVHGIEIMKRAAVLGMISKDKQCIAVAGTHGKTTTSAILAWLMHDAGYDISAFLGGISGNFNTNFLLGLSDYVVVEADEYDRSFLQLHPQILILNALDPDHLDIYGSPEEMRMAYYQLIRQMKPGGILIAKAGLDIPDAVFDGMEITRVEFGWDTGDWVVRNWQDRDGTVVFDLEGPGTTIRDIHFTMPGRHNTMNVVAAIISCLHVGIKPAQVLKSTAQFRGVNRRFQVHYADDKMVYVDDYAHHPVELDGLVTAARTRFPGRKICCIFQPHLFTRTRDFAAEFARVMDKFDVPVVTDIYPARELPIPGVDAHLVLGQMRHPDKKYISRDQVADFVCHQEWDILITAGAGDVDTLIPVFIEHFKTRRL